MSSYLWPPEAGLIGTRLVPSRWQYCICTGVCHGNPAQDVRQASKLTLGTLPSVLREWSLDHPEVETFATAPATRNVRSPWTAIYRPSSDTLGQ
jgi:hypothetical protein